jgi:transcriptional regulator with XRE-family HTH domain
MKQHGEYKYISTGIVKHLIDDRGMSVTQIADRLGVTKSYISKVKAGERSLTLDHLGDLERITSEPIAFLMLKAMDPESVPPEVKPLYRIAWKMMAPQKKRAAPKSRAPSATAAAAGGARSRSKKAA